MAANCTQRPRSYSRACSTVITEVKFENESDRAFYTRAALRVHVRALKEFPAH